MKVPFLSLKEVTDKNLDELKDAIKAREDYVTNKDW